MRSQINIFLYSKLMAAKAMGKYIYIFTIVVSWYQWWLWWWFDISTRIIRIDIEQHNRGLRTQNFYNTTPTNNNSFLFFLLANSPTLYVSVLAFRFVLVE